MAAKTMQCLAADHLRITAIPSIACQRVSQIGHMHPDLMGPACFQPKPRKAVPISLGENLVMRHCTLTIWGDLAQNMRGACPANRRVDGAGTLPGASTENRQIFFFYPACQPGRRVGILRHHDNTGCILIQPADRPGREASAPGRRTMRQIRCPAYRFDAFSPDGRACPRAC